MRKLCLESTSKTEGKLLKWFTAKIVDDKVVNALKKTLTNKNLTYELTTDTDENGKKKTNVKIRCTSNDAKTIDNWIKDNDKDLTESYLKENNVYYSTDELISWLAYHDQACEDIENYYGESIWDLSADDIWDWLYDHNQLLKDCLSYFGMDMPTEFEESYVSEARVFKNTMTVSDEFKPDDFVRDPKLEQLRILLDKFRIKNMTAQGLKHLCYDIKFRLPNDYADSCFGTISQFIDELNEDDVDIATYEFSDNSGEYLLQDFLHSLCALSDIRRALMDIASVTYLHNDAFNEFNDQDYTLYGNCRYLQYWASFDFYVDLEKYKLKTNSDTPIWQIVECKDIQEKHSDFYDYLNKLELNIHEYSLIPTHLTYPIRANFPTRLDYIYYAVVAIDEYLDKNYINNISVIDCEDDIIDIALLDNPEDDYVHYKFRISNETVIPVEE